MAKKEESNLRATAKKIEKPLARLNGLVQDIMDNISSSNTNKRDRDLSELSKEIDDIIFQDIENLTQFTGDDISTFLVKLFNQQENTVQNVDNIDDLFENEKNGLFTFFQERVKNQNLLYEDLSVITNQLFELKEALYATRDAIVSADDMSNSVSRTLKFKNSSEQDADKQSYISMIESVEKNFKLLQKLKNHIIPNTLQYGRYYVYTVPYAKLFEKHQRAKIKKNAALRATMESVDENFAKDFKTATKLDSSISARDISSSFNSVLESIEIYNDPTGIPVVEGTELSELFDAKKFQKTVAQQERNAKKVSNMVTKDGTVEINSNDVDFNNIKECYVKMIDPRKIIPIKILEETIGYYYIHEAPLQVSKSPFTTNIRLKPGQANAQDVEASFLSKITDKIVKSFDKPFLENNMQFKELILNALRYNDIYKKQLKFEFIPVDYITEFSVNQDEEGVGTSIMLPSLFYAKLYLALLIFKMMTIISKSNDQKVYYVKQSGIDNNVANKIQDVARSIKEKNINFNDLLNYNTMTSKIGAGKDVFMPIGRSGERGIEFDILSGQDVQLNTELMEMLRTSFINATGVPSVIMNYINEADYAKTLVMANAKFLSRVVNFQMDFNPAITELYHKILSYSTDIAPETIDEFEFALATPKTLDTNNMADLINNTDQVINYMIKTLTGEQSSQSEDDNLMKDILYKKFSKELLPMLPWNNAERIFEDARVELETAKIKKARMADNE